MKNPSPADLSGVQNSSLSQKPISVCMHVFTKAREDVRVMREAEALVEAGFAVSIVDIESDPARPAEEFLHGVCLKHLPVSSEFATTRFTKWILFRVIRMFLISIQHLISTKADIYHAHDEATLPACAIAACLRRKPLVFDAHELPLNETSMRWRWLLLLFTGILKFVLPRCAGVITVSPPIAREIHKLYHPRSVTVVRNILPYRRVEKSDRLRQALELGPQVRLALYQGVLQANRGLEKLISAAHFLDPDIVIVLMGQDASGSREYLAKFITSEALGARVKLLPAVPYGELLSWTTSADVGLIIYDPEYSLNVQMCLPNKFFEYLMAGLPVLSSELVAIEELLQTHKMGRVVSSLEPREVGLALNSLLADQAALAEMRTNAQQAVRETLCWEKESTHLLKLYQTIMMQQVKIRKP